MMTNTNEIQRRLLDLAADRRELFQPAEDWFGQQGTDVLDELIQALDNEQLGSICHARILRLLGQSGGETVALTLIESLQRAVRAGNSLVIPAAMEALAEIQTAEANDALIALLAEENRDVVKQAAALVGRTRDVRGILPLVRLLQHADRFVRYSAAVGLSAMNNPTAWQALAAHLEKETDQEIRTLIESARENPGEPRKPGNNRQDKK